MDEETQYKSILDIIEKGEFNIASFRATLCGLIDRRKGKYIIAALLETETDTSPQASCNCTPEQMNIRNAQKQIVQLLVNSKENGGFCDHREMAILHYASKFGWLDVTQSLLEKGADPNVKDADGNTPIIYATECRHYDVVYLLIESGADILCRRNSNYTLLHAASYVGWFNFVQFLLKKGADPNAATSIGFTPLHCAVAESHRGVMDLLIESGANVRSSTVQGRSVLHLAIEKSCLEVVKCLVERGANLNDNRFRGSTPLFLACSCKKITVIEYLVSVLNIKNGSNNTPLNFIIKTCPKLKLVTRFIERGGYLQLVDYHRALGNPSLKEGILQNAQICTQAIINKFNNKDLPDLYKLPMSDEMLPRMEKLSIKSEEITQSIRDSVRSEIETMGHCNLLKSRAIVLRMMAVKSYLDYYYDDLKKKSQLKRSAVVDTDDRSESPSKMLCLD